VVVSSPPVVIPGVRLDELTPGIEVEELTGDAAVEISDLAYDSGRVQAGTLFFCVPGQTRDGHDFAAAAAEAGAAALVVERRLDVPATQVRVADARAAMAPLAARFWGDPTAELVVAGVTGTNGKTTTAFLLREILEADCRPVGLLGTVKQVVGGVEEDVVRTTPEAIDLQATFRRMIDGGDQACVMEVSSHALALHRADAIHFDTAIFTNLSQDHLDFHSDMEDYFRAKSLLFEAGPRASVVNADDPYGQRLAESIDSLTFSTQGAVADFRATDVELGPTGASFTVEAQQGSARVKTRLRGAFNVSNALAALAAAHTLGVELESAAEALSAATGVPGRFEAIDEGQPFAVLVDYAHTPEALENVLAAARPLTEGRLVSVFGAGGDRDREKRPQMGRIAAELSDLAIVTSDNPRSEDPAAIIEEILAGIPADRHPRTRSGGDAGVLVEADRRAAIGLALHEAGAGDTVVIAGKGHEQGQEFEEGRKIPFDDREVAREELRAVLAESP
jgi:UDP-N-acetylmuramoyl-L-alanyl-D-glutamate--2,6-diaminopimelate ligase